MSEQNHRLQRSEFRIRIGDAVDSSSLESKPAPDESFWTTPFGALISISAVAGLIWFLGVNMGVSHGMSKFT